MESWFHIKWKIPTVLCLTQVNRSQCGKELRWELCVGPAWLTGVRRPSPQPDRSGFESETTLVRRQGDFFKGQYHCALCPSRPMRWGAVWEPWCPRLGQHERLGLPHSWEAKGAREAGPEGLCSQFPGLKVECVHFPQGRKGWCGVISILDDWVSWKGRGALSTKTRRVQES